MKKRKYMSEFGLNVSTNHKTLIPFENLEAVDDNHNYHIYFVLSCPKVQFDLNSPLVNDEKGISFTLNRLLDGEIEKIEIKNLLLEKHLDHTKLELTSKYPYNYMNVVVNDKNFLKKHTGKVDAITYDIEAQYLLNFTSHVPIWEFEVLYVGKSYGKDGNRNALTRLKKHEKLLHILSDYHMEHPDKRIYILLLEINPRLLGSFDGISKSFMVTDDEDEEHFETLFRNPLKYEQMINITEAAIIHYFKPKYNTNFINNFPKNSHTGYRQYLDLDFNQLVIEIDLEFDSPSSNIQLYTKYNRINHSFDFIRYKLFTDKNRKSMNDIFIANND